MHVNTYTLDEPVLKMNFDEFIYQKQTGILITCDVSNSLTDNLLVW